MSTDTTFTSGKSTGGAMYASTRGKRCTLLEILRYGELLLILLLISGIEPNPGPRRPKFPCGICSRACKMQCIACDECDQWIHKSCIGMSSTEFTRLGDSSETWKCPKCNTNNTSQILYTPSVAQDVSQHCSILIDTPDRSPISRNTTHLSSPIASSISQTSSPNSTNASLMSENTEAIRTSSPKPGGNKTCRQAKGLRILNINFQSLRKKGKLLESIIMDSDPDIILGTETWLDKNIASSEILPQELMYAINRRDRDDDAHGGVLIASKRHLEIHNIQKSADIEMISGDININNKKISICCYYRPPNRTDDEYISKSVEEMHLLKQRSKRNTILLIGGDFNIPDINWTDMSIERRQYPAKVNQAFLDMIADNGLEQLVNFHTRKDRTLDLILTSHPSFKVRCKPMPSIGNSDHDIVLLDTTIKAQRPKPAKRKIWLWKRADEETIKNSTKVLTDSILNKQYNQVEEIWSDYKNGLIKIMEDHVPNKMTTSRFTHPWINTEIKRLIRRKRRAYLKARGTNKKRDRDRYKKLQQQTQWEIRRAHQNYMKDIISESLTEKPKKFWSYLKSKGQESSGVAPLRNNQGFLKSDNQSKANILNAQFSSVFTREDNNTTPYMGESKIPTMADIEISPNGVHKLLTHQNVNKAPGPDKLPTKILKLAATEISPALTKLFQISLNTGEVPRDWKEANIVPLFKKGDTHKAANYRPVSLTSITCKILEHIIHSNIMKHFDDHQILCDNQHGFRKRRSCETQLLITIDNIAKSVSQGKQVDLILLDFEKAFDKVPHGRLLHKLQHYGVRGQANNWVKSFLSDRKQQVVLEGVSSGKEDVVSGVPQGTVLGPLLFLTYINDMPSTTKSDIRLFADDSMLYREIAEPADQRQLQKDLSALEKWENDWQMRFNPSKCIVIQVHPQKKAPSNFQYKLHDQVLEKVESGKYLGVNISEDLLWDKHIHGVAAKGNRILGFLRRNLKDCTKTVKITSYTTILRPSLEYASVLWDPSTQTNSKIVEQVQRRTARFVHNDYSSRTPGCVTRMLKDLKWESLEQRRKNNRLAMLYRINKNLVDITSTKYLRESDKRTRGAHKFYQERTNAIYGNSFFPRTIRDWNRLSENTAFSKNLDMFQAKLRS